MVFIGRHVCNEFAWYGNSVTIGLIRSFRLVKYRLFNKPSAVQRHLHAHLSAAAAMMTVAAAAAAFWLVYVFIYLYFLILKGVGRGGMGWNPSVIGKEKEARGPSRNWWFRHAIFWWCSIKIKYQTEKKMIMTVTKNRKKIKEEMKSERKRRRRRESKHPATRWLEAGYWLEFRINSLILFVWLVLGNWLRWIFILNNLENRERRQLRIAGWRQMTEPGLIWPVNGSDRLMDSWSYASGLYLNRAGKVQAMVRAGNDKTPADCV